MQRRPTARRHFRRTGAWLCWCLVLVVHEAVGGSRHQQQPASSWPLVVHPAPVHHNLLKRQLPMDNESLDLTMDADGNPIAPAGLTVVVPVAPHQGRLPSSSSLLSALGTSSDTSDALPVGAVGKMSNQPVAAAASNRNNNGQPSIASQQMATPYALAQEATKAANSVLNAELCKSFSVGTQNENGGSFTSPSYPNPYPTDLICTRLIEAPAGHYIVLEFRDIFEIEAAGNDCDNDKIEIRDGRYGYSKVLARYCGINFPPEVRSTNEPMWLRFISDASITHRGFKAVYRFEKQKNIKPNPPFECRFNVTSSMSSIMTGNGTETKSWIHSGVIKNTDVPDKLLNYTKQFNVSLECIWNITVMPGWKIYLTFSNYELNKPNDCDSNFIEIYEENLTEENQTVKFCGTRTEPQTSKSNVFNIRHHALPTASTSKFEIIYTAFREKGAGACDARTEFDCDDGTCIHESLRCDGLVNCKYRYDENSDPGPCPGSDPDSPFFETEHMVIILIVFLTLVSGMCASIVVSCWGKIQERRRRKLDYHIRKSREASMEGQLNEVDQMVYGSTKDRSIGSNNKLRIAQSANAIAVSDNYVSSGPRTVEEAILAVNGNQKLSKTSVGFDANNLHQQNFIPGVQYHQAHPLTGQITVDQRNQGIYSSQAVEQQKRGMASNSGPEVRKNGFKDDGGQYSFYGTRTKVYDSSSSELRKSQLNLQHSIMSSIASAQTRNQLNYETNKQKKVPDISYNNQMKMKPGLNVKNQVVLPITNVNHPHDAQHQRQLLNFSSNRNQQPIQHQQSLVDSIYQQRQFQPDNETNNIDSNNLAVNNNSSSNNHGSCEADNIEFIQGANNEQVLDLISMPANQTVGSYLRHRQNFTSETPARLPSNDQANSAGYILSNYNNIVKQSRLGGHTGNTPQIETIQKLNYDNSVDGQFVRSLTYNPDRALTLSAIHQSLLNNQQHQRNPQAMYGYNINQHTGGLTAVRASNLSSSISCCNALGDFANETPLLNDLLVRSNQQQYRLNDDQEMRSLTMVPSRLTNVPSFPRSLSAYQLSRAQVRQPQLDQLPQLQQQYLQQRHEEQRPNHQPQPQPPAPLPQQQQQQQQQQHLQHKSMSDAGRVSRLHQAPNHSLSYPHACTGAHLTEPGKGGVQSPAIPPPPPPPNLANVRASSAASGLAGNQQIDGRRAAFKVSRLDPTQLTGDTLQESIDVPGGGNVVFGSMQMDEASTESDPTFGLLMNSIGNTSMNLATTLAHHQTILPHNVPVGASGALVNQSNQQATLQRCLPASQAGQSYNQRSIIGGQSLRNLNQAQILTHLAECNFIRQRAAIVNHRQDTIVNQPLICDCGALERANHMRLQLQVASSSHEFDDSDDGAYMLHQPQYMMQQQVGAPNSGDPTLMSASCRPPTTDLRLAQSKQHSSLADSIYGQQRQQQFSRFRHQSSSLTADGEEDDVNDDDDDDDVDGYGMERASDNLVATANMLSAQRSAITPYQSKVVNRSETLRDSPKNIITSHTNMSCQSCTCGSQLQLNNLDELSDDTSGSKQDKAGAANLDEKLKVAEKVRMVDDDSQTNEDKPNTLTKHERNKIGKDLEDRINVMPGKTCDSTNLESSKG